LLGGDPLESGKERRPKKRPKGKTRSQKSTRTEENKPVLKRTKKRATDARQAHQTRKALGPRWTKQKINRSWKERKKNTAVSLKVKECVILKDVQGVVRLKTGCPLTKNKNTASN